MPRLDSVRLALRDVFLAVVLIVCLAFPSLPGGVISKLGVQHAEVLGSKFDFNQAKTQAEAISKTKNDADTLVAVLDKALPTAASLPEGQVTHVLDLARTVQSSANSADNAAKTALVQQQSLAGAAPPPGDGWIFLGVTDQNHSQWIGQQTTDATLPDPGKLKGQTLLVQDAVYLRSGPDTAPAGSVPWWRANQPILDALPVGQRVRVDAAEVSPTRAGRYSVWAKVERVG